ncbi:hypothetical protein ACP4OV_018633 [Aristida adscensionis]
MPSIIADVDSFPRIYPLHRIHPSPLLSSPLPGAALKSGLRPARLLPPWSSTSLSSHHSLLHQRASCDLSVRVSVGIGASPSSARLGMQDKLICSSCKRLLQYRRGAGGVCCPACNTFTPANPSSEPEMSEMMCSRCPTLLVYNRGVANIRCPHCSTVNSTRSGQLGHLSCGQCRTILAYQMGASTVGCPGCRYVNHVRDARPQTVLVENPKTLDDKGKLVSNVVVGVTSWKR